MVEITKVKLFFSFWIIYITFMHWGSCDSNSYFFLTRSIYENRQFTIDKYANETCDRSVYNDHYYSCKVPGLSIISLIPYTVFDRIFNILEPQGKTDFDTNLARGEERWPAGAILRYPIFTNRFESWSRTFITAFTSALFGAITVVLIYEMSKIFASEKKHRLLIAVIAGLGTPLFQESVIYRNHALSTMLTFLSFFILFKTRDKTTGKEKYFLLSGLSIGLAMLCDLSAGIAFLVLSIYGLTRGDIKSTLLFLLGAAIMYTPMFYYNYYITGDPLHYVGLQNGDVKIFGYEALKAPSRAFGMIPNGYIIYRQLFDPYKGLFFYYPILLLSIIGLIKMVRKYPRESLTVLLMFIAYVTKFSSWYLWFGSGSSISRFLTPVIPFLILPLAYYAKEADKRLLSLLTIISLFNGFATMQQPEYIIMKPSSGDYKPQYAAIMNSFTPLPYTLFIYYFPLFITNGPRAPLVDHLVGGFSNVDIQDRILYNPRMPPFTNLIPLAVILVFIWRREVFDRKGNSWRWWIRERVRKLSYVGFVLAALITVYIVLMLLTYAPAEGEEPINQFFALAIVAMSLVITYLMRCVSRVFRKPDEGKEILQKNG